MLLDHDWRRRRRNRRDRRHDEAYHRDRLPRRRHRHRDDDARGETPRDREPRRDDDDRDDRSPGAGGDDLATLLALTNDARAQTGAGPLTVDPALTTAAQGHADDMARQGYFDHDSLDGRSPHDRMRAAGYRGRSTGENIAAGQDTPDEAHRDWMGSPGHRRNILDPDFDRIGLGIAQGDAGTYWVQNFGG